MKLETSVIEDAKKSSENFMNSITTIKQLYESDYLEWLSVTATQLQERQLDKIDYENLLEELDGLGREQKNKVDSYLRQLLIHLLLYAYWDSEKAYCAKGWETEIDDFRFELELLLKSKTLYNYFLTEIEFIYLFILKLKSKLSKKLNFRLITFLKIVPLVRNKF